jgi:DNA-binding GntR family transcriptional regulator
MAAGTDYSTQLLAEPFAGRGTQIDLAYQALQRDIVSGVRLPDERLRIERLKQLYGIGPTPLREALQRLVADGLVVAIDNRGFRVAPLDPAEFEDINAARTTLEVEALRRSIRAGGEDWEARVAGVAYRLHKLDAALKSENRVPDDAWEAANDAFHRATISACDSRWILRLREIANMQCERYRRASVALRRAERDLEFEHRAIADAVLERDAERACGLVAEHYLTTTRILVGELNGRTENGAERGKEE